MCSQILTFKQMLAVIQCHEAQQMPWYAFTINLKMNNC